MTTVAADVCVIGGGLAGALVTYELARRGIQVVLLEAGRERPLSQRMEAMHAAVERGVYPWESDLPERDVYTIDSEFDYPLNRLRVKALGGTTLHWGGLATRYVEDDFRMSTRYGLAEDWPIGYELLEPYYCRAERALGVCGTDDNPFAAPRSTGYPMPAFPYNHTDEPIIRACRELGVRTHHVPWARNRRGYDNRPACAAFSTCQRYHICPIGAQYTAERHIEKAIATGNARVVTGANVVRLDTNRHNLIEAAIYVDRESPEMEQRAAVFVLAAHAVESARLLLLSANGRQPNGLANSSRMVGKCLMDHFAVSVIGVVEQNLLPFRIGFHTLESHQYCNPAERDTRAGWKLAFRTSVAPTPADIAAGSDLWGDALAEEVRSRFGHRLAIAAQIEQLPAESNVVTLDPQRRDCFGNPVPRIRLAVGAYTTSAAERAKTLISEILAAFDADEENMRGLGAAAHTMGTCRMGNDPERSVVDADLRSHDIDNLFIVGSSTFVTGGTLQPSLTIAALAIRAADRIAATGPGRRGRA